MKQNIKKYVIQSQLVIFILVGGIIFLTITGRWKSYGEPFVRFYVACRDLGRTGMAKDGSQGKMDPGKDSVNEGELSAKNTQIGEDGQNTTVDNLSGEDKTVQQGMNEEVNAVTEETTPKEVEWQEVDDSYFDDALFIGDSRVVGLQDYGQLQEHATFYASTGLNIFRLLSARIATVEGQRKKVSVEEALGQRQFGKIYLMVGINELDIGTVERFEETYKATIERIQELQPDAIIYIQSIMKVTTKRASKGDFVTNEGIIARNDAIMKLADNEKVFYLDVNEAVCDESGGMNPIYTSDGIHLKVKYIPLWREYLEKHAVVTQ